MNFTTKIILLVSGYLAVVLLSCNVDATYENRKEDKEAAEAVTNEFLKYLKNRQVSSTYPLFTRNFFTITDTSKLSNTYQQLYAECGYIVDYSLLDWRTLVVKGSNPHSEYVMLYEVTYTKCKTEQKISLRKEDDTVKIISYDVKLLNE